MLHNLGHMLGSGDSEPDTTGQIGVLANEGETLQDIGTSFF